MSQDAQTIQIDPLAALKVVSLERDTLRNALLVAENQNLTLQREVERIGCELERMRAIPAVADAGEE